MVVTLRNHSVHRHEYGARGAATDCPRIVRRYGAGGADTVRCTGAPEVTGQALGGPSCCLDKGRGGGDEDGIL